jgi:hypothetical protein
MERTGYARITVMPRYTAAYSNFIRRLEEVETILRRAQEASRQPATRDNVSFVNALCRSGVVLLSSHIEGYLKDLGEIAVQRIAMRRLPKGRLGAGFRFYFSRDLINEIKNTSEPAQIASKVETLFSRDLHIWSPDPNFAGTLSTTIFFGDFANPNHKRIKKFFNRFGYVEYDRDLAVRLAADFNACSNIVNQVVQQRNAIAHGDMVTTGTPTDLAQMLTLVKQYCRKTDDVVGDWFRTKRCPIR